MADDKSTLNLPDQAPIQLSIRHGTLGQPVVDIQQLG